MSRTSAGLIIFPLLALWKEKFDDPGLQNIIASFISIFILRFIHSMKCEIMILEYESVRWKGSSFYKLVC